MDKNLALYGAYVFSYLQLPYGECFVSTVLFDRAADIIHDRVRLYDISPTTKKEYFTQGTTALFNVVGGAVRHIGSIHKYAREEDIPKKRFHNHR